MLEQCYNLKNKIEEYRSRFFVYESLTELSKNSIIVLTSFCSIYFVLLCFLISYNIVDNENTVSSSRLWINFTKLPLNFESLFELFFGKSVTPAPVFDLGVRVLYTVFGYSVKSTLILTSLISTIGLFSFGSIIARRLGIYSALLALGLIVSYPFNVRFILSGGYYHWALSFWMLGIFFFDLFQIKNKTKYLVITSLLFASAALMRPEFLVIGLIIPFFTKLSIKNLLILSFIWVFPVIKAIYWMIKGAAEKPNSYVNPESYLEYSLKWISEIAQLFTSWRFSAIDNYLWILGILGLYVLYRKSRFILLSLIYFFTVMYLIWIYGRFAFNFYYYYLFGIYLFTFSCVAGAYQLHKILKSLLRKKFNNKISHSVPIFLILIWVLSTNSFKLLPKTYTKGAKEHSRQLRTYINDNIDRNANIVLDYEHEVPWLLAELGNEKRKIWYYNTNPSKIPRPHIDYSTLYTAEYDYMLKWVKNNLILWVNQVRPEYFVLASNDRRHLFRKHPHYKMFGINLAIEHPKNTDKMEILFGEILLKFEKIYENSGFDLYKIIYPVVENNK